MLFMLLVLVFITGTSSKSSIVMSRQDMGRQFISTLKKFVGTTDKVNLLNSNVILILNEIEITIIPT